jgi:transposase-like protein
MSTENAQSAPAADTSTASASVNAGTDTSTTTTPPASSTPGLAPNVQDAQAPVTPAYQPNYKYKAALQDKELDEFWRPLVKDQDSEKKVKELFTKVDAFDFVKTRKEALEEQYGSLSADYEHMSTTVKNVEDSLQRNDLTSVFRQLGVSTPQVFQWAQKQIQRMELPTEQREEVERYEQTEQQKYGLEQEVSQLRQQYQTQAVQARTMQLDMALSRPEVAQFSQAWDANGGDGSFRDFVVEQAKTIFYTTKQDISPEQAIANVMQRFGKFLNTGENVSQAPQAPGSMQGVPQNMKPVIPNITGKAASPIKKVPKSLDDLKKLAKDASMSL